MSVDDFYNFYDQLLIRSLDLRDVEFLEMTERTCNRSSLHRRIFDTVVNQNIKTSQFLLNLEKMIDSSTRSKESFKLFESVNDSDKLVIFLFSDDDDVTNRKQSSTNSQKLKTIKIENAKTNASVNNLEESQISINLITDKYRNIKLILQNFNLQQSRCKLRCNF